MIKKDSFELIVRVLRNSKPFECTPEQADSDYNYGWVDGYSSGKESLFNEIIDNFIHELVLVNPEFNKSKFRDTINS